MNYIPAFSSPWLWALLAAIPVGIVLLYFLKLRREPIEVPSTFLWSKTIEDLHVNSLLQRLRRSLLLLMQLLVVTLAAIALFQPGFRSEIDGTGRKVFLLDASASMNATDGEADRTRFEVAVQQIADQIQAMTDTQTGMLITFSDRAEVLQSFTSDRRRLREALARAKPTNRPTDILGALRAADGLANPRRSSELGDVNDVQVADAMPADLLLFSDGGFQPVTEFNLGNLKPVYHAIGTQSPANLAITAFSAERNVEDPTQVQAFATLANTGPAIAASNVSLTIDGELVDASAVEIEPGQQTGVSFELVNNEAVTMKLVIDEKDALTVDNEAYAGLSPLKRVSVLVVTTGNQPLQMGLTTPKSAQICASEFVDPDFLETPAYQQRVVAGVDDLIIYDRCSPKEMPPTNTFFIGALPPSGWTWDSEPGSVVLVDVDRVHPLMRFVDLYSLLIFEGRSVAGPDGVNELVAGDNGSILSIASRQGYQDLVLGFEVVSTGESGGTQANTNWYAERSWPVFVLNVLRYLAGAAEASGAPSYRPGETVRLRLENAVDEVAIDRNGDLIMTAKPNSSGIVEVVDTDAVGNYSVREGTREVDLFAVNLFDRDESTIAVGPEVELGYEAVEATVTMLETRKEFWRWLLIGMLGLLAAEWWYYGKRVA